MKTLDQIVAEIERRGLFISNLTQRLSPSMTWEAMCFLKRRDGAGFQIGRGPTIADALTDALARFGGSKAEAADEFEDLLG
ncbi:MAG: hypothetical protein DI537_20275 [Stutzerimonas stutzeri]|nr:MAG: hypothetical protein DI537_20275 [Stutzerimonas stutzeri]